jgi:hypothetical protein
MEVLTTTPPRTPGDRAHFTFWSLGAGAGLSSDEEPAPHPVPVAERLRKLPEALLLTAGYYGGRLPLVRELLKPRD